MSNPSIYGCWLLETCRLSFSDNRPSKRPFQHGMISYHDNGHMQACLSVHPRPQTSTKDLERGHKLSKEEKSLCFDQFLSYSGTFTISQDQVHHHVLMSLNPAVIGTTLIRKFHFERELLILSYEYQVRENLSCQYELRWENTVRAL
ncbi:MAG: hypothetical protein CL916_07970 [Deltaproteobacteria bacterium]|nr:hypothetical protein [Deltaproteobacteria bacterium]